MHRQAAIAEKYIITVAVNIAACLDIKSQLKGVLKMKCPVCGQNAWHTVVRRDNSKPAGSAWVTVLYRVCTKCNYEEKMQPPAENNTEKK
jgi:C4-type Zn-finger protein